VPQLELAFPHQEVQLHLRQVLHLHQQVVDPHSLDRPGRGQEPRGEVPQLRFGTDLG